MLPRLLALFLLGTALLKTLMTWPFRRGRSLKAFAGAFGPEGLLPVTLELHQELARPGACTACGRCDAVVATGHGTALVSGLLRGASRSLTDWDLAAQGFARFSADELARAESLCPVGVPIQRVVSQIQAEARRRSPA